MKFSKEDTLKLVKVIHEFNQDFKNIPGGSGEFHIDGSRAFSFFRNQLYGVYADYNIGKKDDIVQTLVDNELSFCISTKQFFDFQRDYKKNITNAEINEKGFIYIYTDIPGIFYTSYGGFAYSVEKKVLDEYTSKLQNEKITEVELSSENLLQLKNINVPTTLYINFDSNTIGFYPSEIKHIKFRMAYKYLFNKIIDGESCKVSVCTGNYQFKDDRGYIISLNNIGKKINAQQFFRVIDY